MMIQIVHANVKQFSRCIKIVHNLQHLGLKLTWNLLDQEYTEYVIQVY